jgi:hypothetical protein
MHISWQLHPSIYTLFTHFKLYPPIIVPVLPKCLTYHSYQIITITITITILILILIIMIFTATIGAGLLSLPWAMSQVGSVFGTILLTIFAFLTLYAMDRLDRACTALNEKTYSGVASRLFDKAVSPYN